MQQALEHTNTQTNKANGSEDQQQGIFYDGSPYLTDPTDGFSENFTDRTEDSAHSYRSSLDSSSFQGLISILTALQIKQKRIRPNR